MFLVGWVFFGIAAGIGVLLRLQFVFPVPGVDYGNFLHAHSHIAFLGWVYNAFFALAVKFFVPLEKVREYWRLFLVTQISVVGILFSFPIQGYGWISIFFSTMQMVCAAVFICKLLRKNRAGPVARKYLWIAGGFMLISGLGPIALGPIMAGGWGDTIWHALAIGYYLHFQYNGWFIFFLMAVVFQAMHERMPTRLQACASRALPWLIGGCVLTFSLSLLPVKTDNWVFFVAFFGGVAQLVGCFLLVRSLRGAELFSLVGRIGLARILLVGALGLFLLKVVLQALAAWPGLVDLATNHFVVIAFMHLVFLGIVTPVLIGWALLCGWMQFAVKGSFGVGILAVGALISQLTLVYLPLAGTLDWPAWLWFPETQLFASITIFLGVICISLDQCARLRIAAKSPGVGRDESRRFCP